MEPLQDLSRPMGSILVSGDILWYVFGRPERCIPPTSHEQGTVNGNVRPWIHQCTRVATDFTIVTLSARYDHGCLFHVRIPVEDVGLFSRDPSSASRPFEQ